MEAHRKTGRDRKWVAVANREKIITKNCISRFDRQRNIQLTSVSAPEHARLLILNLGYLHTVKKSSLTGIDRFTLHLPILFKLLNH